MSRRVELRSERTAATAELAGGDTVRVNGEAFTVAPHGPDRVVVAGPDGRRHVIAIAADGAALWLFAAGRPWRVEAAVEGTRPRRSGADAANLTAPMPATVAAIPAPPGTAVSAGDPVVVLEAMKMELVVRAPRDGRVSAVHCQVGELVQPGRPLAEITP
jgi:biotin carboxyl carrier protein